MLLAACLWSFCCLARSARSAAISRQEQSNSEKAGFEEFQQRVQVYERIRNDARSGIPPAHKKDAPGEIQKHQQALAQKVQDARKEAKQGDVFTANAKGAFRQEIQKVFEGTQGNTIRRTLVQGSPVRVELFVNKKYPDTIPVTTVPPTLLQHFPRLPKLIEYRIVGDNLVLEDTESRLVVDIFPGAFPNAPPH